MNGSTLIQAERGQYVYTSGQ